MASCGSSSYKQSYSYGCGTNTPSHQRTRARVDERPPSDQANSMPPDQATSQPDTSTECDAGDGRGTKGSFYTDRYSGQNGGSGERVVDKKRVLLASVGAALLLYGASRYRKQKKSRAFGAGKRAPPE